MYQPKKQQRNDLEDFYSQDNKSKQTYNLQEQSYQERYPNKNNQKNYQPEYQQTYHRDEPNNSHSNYGKSSNHQNQGQSYQGDSNQSRSSQNYEEQYYDKNQYQGTRYTDQYSSNNYEQNNYQVKPPKLNQNYVKGNSQVQQFTQKQPQGTEDYNKGNYYKNKQESDQQYKNYTDQTRSYQDQNKNYNKHGSQSNFQQNQQTNDVKYNKDNYNNQDNDIHDYQDDEYYEEDVDGNQHQDDEYYDQYDKEDQNDQQQQLNEQNHSGLLKILMVAEKNSIAEAISKALGSVTKMKKGKTQCYYFTGHFRGQKASFIVTATNGHIFNRDFSKEYADWESVDPLKLFKANTMKRAVPKSGIVRQLENAANDCNYLLLWLDNDREGENICFEVEEVCQPYLRKGYKVLRAKFSSITSQDLKIAFDSIHLQPNLMESLAVDARQIIDLKIGVAFSRFQTMYFTKKYPALKDKLITYGPCQTPTLGFCVARHEEIQNFRPKTYYQIHAQLQNQNGFKSNADWEGDRIFQEKEARDLVTKLKQLEYFDVIESTIHQMTKARPEGVNTVNLLKFASSFLGIGPQQTMHVAERLYLSGFLSYPRTESTTYPEHFATDQILKELKNYESQEISKHAQMLTKSGHSAPKSGKDAGDHPPITPTILVPTNLLGNEKGIYEYVVKMFLATHSGDCHYNHSTLRVKPTNINVSFKMTGNKTITPGFTAIASWLAVGDDSFDPQKYITENKVFVASVDYKAAQTTPPGHLSESDLIGLMEQYGIGTDASMATHINNICERNYVRVEVGARRLAPTELGLCLVRGYKKIDAELVAPLLRSNIEKQCDSIARGTAKFQDVIDKVIETFEEKFIYFTTNISKMDEIFAPRSEIIGKQSQSSKSRTKGGYKRQGGRKGRNQDQEEGPSHVPIQVTLADFVKPALEAKKPQPKEQLQQAPVQRGKKNFKSKKDGDDLLY